MGERHAQRLVREPARIHEIAPADALRLEDARDRRGGDRGADHLAGVAHVHHLVQLRGHARLECGVGLGPAHEVGDAPAVHRQRAHDERRSGSPDPRRIAGRHQLIEDAAASAPGPQPAPARLGHEAQRELAEPAPQPARPAGGPRQREQEQHRRAHALRPRHRRPPHDQVDDGRDPRGTRQPAARPRRIHAAGMPVETAGHAARVDHREDTGQRDHDPQRDVELRGQSIRLGARAVPEPARTGELARAREREQGLERRHERG